MLNRINRAIAPDAIRNAMLCPISPIVLAVAYLVYSVALFA